MSIFEDASAKMLAKILCLHSKENMSERERDGLEHLKNYLIRGSDYMDECTHALVLGTKGLEYIVSPPKKRSVSVSLGEKFEFKSLNQESEIKPFNAVYDSEFSTLHLYFDPQGSEGIYMKMELIPKVKE